MAGKPSPMSKTQQVLPIECTVFCVFDQVFPVTGLLVGKAQRFVEHSQRGIDKGNGMPATEDKLIPEGFVAVADVPNHGSAEHQREQHVYFGA
ncbi:hypothetical protein SDC9_112071 [bioreactor metagenome]|uniref:Uncharacterized protein n=1 Tax=bioreactor metagenome TaxID=1076179 RepID=A0A645BI80_9ZZZZ